MSVPKFYTNSIVFPMAWIQIQFAKPKKIVREHTEEKNS